MTDAPPPAAASIVANGKVARAAQKRGLKLNTDTGKRKAGVHDLAKHHLIHGEVPNGR
jgi:hypothetical protein